MFRDCDCITTTVVGDLDVQLVQRCNVDHVRARTDRLHESQVGTFERQLDREGRGGGNDRSGLLPLRVLLIDRLGDIPPLDLNTFRGELPEGLQLSWIVARQDVDTRAHEALLYHGSEPVNIRCPLYRSEERRVLPIFPGRAAGRSPTVVDRCATRRRYSCS